MVEKTALGNRMKAYEKSYIAQKSMPLLPVIARLDGKSFHTWTKGLDRPFDRELITIMQETMKKLVEESGATVGYTQSDEITLIFYSDDPRSQIFFNGKLYKMTSVLASMCTAYFEKNKTRFFTESFNQKGLDGIESYNKYVKGYMLFNKPPALFDCRVFQVPTLDEVINCLIWREQDATRNSIQMAGNANFSHKQLYKKSTSVIQEMLFQEHGINWNEYEWFEKRGTYARRLTREIPFSVEELDRLPTKHQARSNPDLKITRSLVEMVELPILSKIDNRVGVMFNGEDPIMRAEC